MRSISYAFALVGALGLVVACGDSSGDGGDATPAAPSIDESPADNAMKGPDAAPAAKADTAMPDVPAAAAGAVADMQTVTLEIAGMT